MTGLIVFVVIAVIIVLWVISIYNSLVRLRNNRENAFADIDVQLKQRYDLVPQLVETVKGYAKHESTVLQNVTNARAAAMSATTIDDKIKADNALTSALAGLKVSLEAYPDLKANQNFLQLQDELADETRKRCRELGYPKFTDEQTMAYTELGGTPFLDGQYTVFGEVVEGLDVVEKIQNCETLRDDRPKEDVAMQVEVVNE